MAAAITLTLGTTLLGVTGCTTVQTKRPGTLSVVVGFYPIEFAADAVGGAGFTITDLTKPGVEPHDIELSPQQVATIATADIVAYIPGLAPAVDEAVMQNNPKAALDVTKGITRLTAASDGAAPCNAGEACTFIADPHVWLDPLNEAQIGKNISDRAATLMASKASTFDSGYKSLLTQMSLLNTSFSTGLTTCQTRTMVVSHAAFGYLAHAYDLTQVGISGIDPQSEPSPARLAEVATIAKAHNVTTIYYERLVTPAVAETLASTLNITAAVLDPLEGRPPAGNYTTQMKANLATLITGQRCS